MKHERLILAVVALLALLPAALPGADWYMDNPAHLAEVEAISRHVLPGFVGWVPDLNLGQPLVQQAAPLVWVPLAWLRKLGLPLWPLYVLGLLASNVVFALGAHALGRRILGEGPAALLAAALLACTPIDLYGIAGAAGGMWPYRLSNGLLFFLLARPWKAWQQALLLGAVLLIHPFTALIAFGAVALEALVAARERRWSEALATSLALPVAVLLASAWLVPLLGEPELRALRFQGLMSPISLAAITLLPVEIAGALGGRGLSFLGGPTSGIWLATSAVGLLFCWRARPADRGLALRLGLCVMVLLAALIGFYLYTDIQPLGPIPWRHTLYARVLLALLAGAGLASLVPVDKAPVLAVLLGLGASMVGWRELPVSPEDRAVEQSLQRTWQALAEARPQGVVYQADTFQAPRVAEALSWSHPGGQLYLEQGLPVMGSWFRLSPSAVNERAYSEGWRLFGVPDEELGGDALYASARRYGVGALVTVDKRTRDRLAVDPRWVLVAEDGIFGAFLVRDGASGRVGSAAGEVELLLDEPTHVQARLPGEGPFRVRSSYHPWWSATLDGQPIELALEESTGMLSGQGGPGLLELRWEDRGAPWRWASLLGLLAVGGLFAARKRL